MIQTSAYRSRKLLGWETWLLLGALTLAPSARAELHYAQNAPVDSYSAVETEEVPPTPVETDSSPRIVISDYVNQSNADAQEAQERLSRSELLRRKRMREELKNEDILQERLEELRLRDEQKRTDVVLGQKEQEAASQESQPVVMETQSVSAPVTDRPGEEPVKETAPATTVVTVSPESYESQAKVDTSIFDESSEKTQFTLNPRFGMPNMINNNYFTVAGRYSAGLGVGIEASDQLQFEVGYSYNEYGVSMASTNPFYGYSYNPYAPGMTATETLMMSQHVVDAGLKLYFLKPDAKLRPYLVGGGAYSTGSLDTDPTIASQLRHWDPSIANGYSVNSFLGFLGAGLDVKLTRSITVGASMKYFKVLTARQNQEFNNAMFAQPGYFGAYGAGYGLTQSQYEKQMVGGSMAWSNFYTINAGASFTF